mmetsp:Transcript_5982/g.19712  ORF Transcript_5982/g.19712 Transcript_5982/m.19712 type:complete len:204 (+) Transcript_5982:3096-3707(+)
MAKQLVRLGAALRGGRAGLHRRLAAAEPLHLWMGRRLRIRGGRPARLERGRAATCRRLSLLDRERRVKVRRRVFDTAEQQAGSAGTQPRLGRDSPARASWPLGEQRRETRKGLGRPGRRGRQTARCEVGAGERVCGPRFERSPVPTLRCAEVAPLERGVSASSAELRLVLLRTARVRSSGALRRDSTVTLVDFADRSTLDQRQ